MMRQGIALLLVLLGCIANSAGQDMRSGRMSLLMGWQFQCTNTTCLPFATLTAPNVRKCQTACLARVECQGATFRQAQSVCQLFANVRYQNPGLLADTNSISMLTVAGSRVPPELTTTSTTSTSTTTSTSSTTSSTTSTTSVTTTSTTSVTSTIVATTVLLTASPTYLGPGGPAYCRGSGGPCSPAYYYATRYFDVNIAGTYTIGSSSGTGTDLVGYLYNYNFDPNSPSTNQLAGNDDGNGNQFLMSYTCSTGTTYIVVATTYAAGATASYAVSISGPGTVRYF